MPTPLRKRRQIDQIERERAALEAVGVNATTVVLADIRRAVIAAYRDGRDPTKVVAPRFDKLRPILADALLAAHLQGFSRAILQAEAAMERRARRLGPYDKTIEFLVERVGMTAARMTALQKQYGDQAFAVLNQATPDIERSVQRALLNVRARQLTKKDGIKEFTQAINRHPSLNTGSNLIETLYRTQTGIGYTVGRQRANEAPEIASILWGYEYHTVGDDRVRPTHAGFDGMRAPKESSIWDTHMPPLGWNCRCTVTEIYEGEDDAVEVEAGAVEVDGKTVAPKPDAGFDQNFAAVFDADKAAVKRTGVVLPDASPTTLES